jgi:hypothetical protein
MQEGKSVPGLCLVEVRFKNAAKHRNRFNWLSADHGHCFNFLLEAGPGNGSLLPTKPFPLEKINFGSDVVWKSPLNDNQVEQSDTNWRRAVVTTKGGKMTLALSILAILFSLAGLMLPPIQALFPRISLYTYYRQRTVRRGLAITGAILLIPAWIGNPSTLTAVLTAFAAGFWLASELVLAPDKVIPPLDNPPAIPGKASALPDDTQVIGLVVEGQAHAWPMGILIPHHIINETVRGRPVAAAYCPACRSGYVFDPVVAGQRLTFEPVSVHRRNMIMRDRETGTIWQHETGEALMGKYRGMRLEILGGELSNWKAWRTEHPETTVCALPKGYRHPSPLGPIFGRLLDHGPKHIVGPGLAGLDRRLDQHAFIAGITVGDLAKAFPMNVLQRRKIIRDQIGGQPVVIFYDATSDRVRCFSAGSLPSEMALKLQENRLRDPATGLAWDFSGKPTGGTKNALSPVRVYRQWWLAWSEYHPGSLIYAE